MRANKVDGGGSENWEPIYANHTKVGVWCLWASKAACYRKDGTKREAGRVSRFWKHEARIRSQRRRQTGGSNSPNKRHRLRSAGNYKSCQTHRQKRGGQWRKLLRRSAKATNYKNIFRHGHSRERREREHLIGGTWEKSRRSWRKQPSSTGREPGQVRRLVIRRKY